MDTRHGLFFWVEDVARDDFPKVTVLHGHDFEGGLTSLVKVGDSLWLASPRGAIPLEGRVEVRHSQGRGWTLYLSEGNIEAVPCLLCSDAGVRCVYHGQVRLEPNNLVHDLPSLVGKGMPLCGKEWLGVVGCLGDGYYLEAFGRLDTVSVDESIAYCPWWSGSLEEPDGFRVKVFVVEASTSLGA